MPHTNNLLGKHKISIEWYTPEYVWGWIEYIFDCNKGLIFDPCPIKGEGGLEKDWSGNKYVYINPPSPASQWAKRTVSFKGYENMSLLYLSFSESVIWQVPELLSFPTILIRKRIKFVSSIHKEKNIPSNYSAMHLVNGNDEMLHRFIRIGRSAGAVIQASVL